MSRLAIGAVVVLIAVVPAWARGGQTPASVLQLQTLETRALESHPAIREAAARVDEARGRARQAGAWDNPVVGFASDELRPRESPSGFVGGFVEQIVTLGGKRAAARAEGESEVTRALADLETARLRVLAALRAAYYDVVAAEERLRLSERQTALAAESVTLAGQLFNVGLVDRPDVLQAEAEAARAAALRTAAVAQRTGAWHRLAAAAADRSLAPQPLAVSIDAVLPDLDRDATLSRILGTSPVLRSTAAEVAHRRAALEVERRAVRPDLFLRGEAGWNREHLADRTGRERVIGWEFGAEIGLSLPFANRNAGAISASAAALRAAEAAEEGARFGVEARFASAFEDYEAGRAAVVAYRTDVLPRAQQAYELYLARYREMAAPYPQVLIAAQTLADMQEQYLEAFERAWHAALRLEALLADDGMN